MRPRSHRCLPPCHARRGREENPVMRTSMAFALILAVVLVLAPLTAAPVIAQGATPLRVVLPTDRTVLQHHPKGGRSEEHTSELQSRFDIVCRLLPEKKKFNRIKAIITKP